MYQELLQNAEDAGASEVKFVYDHHSYGRHLLHHPDMAAFQVSIHCSVCTLTFVIQTRYRNQLVKTLQCDDRI